MGIIDQLAKKIARYDSSSPVYLGDVVVVPRSAVKRLLEMGWESKGTDQRIAAWINELIVMPLASDAKEIPANALALDILVSNYQCGSDIFNWSEPVIPLAWRPSVKLHGRLVRLSDKEVLGTFAVTKTIGWRAYFLRVLSIKGMFGGAGAFGKDDMQYLLGAGLLELLNWVKKRR